MKFQWIEWNSQVGSDIYNKATGIVSIDLLQDIFSKGMGGVVDDTDNLRNCIVNAVCLLEPKEFLLLFSRFCCGESYKTIKVTSGAGSTRTIVNRVRRLRNALREYTLYFYENNQYDGYVNDLGTIKKRLGEWAEIVADLLFRRWSCSRIYKNRQEFFGKECCVSRRQIYNLAEEICDLCQNCKDLSLFWEVLESVGRV